MQNLSIKATVTGPEGFRFMEAREWDNISAEAADKFLAAQKKILAFISKEHGSKVEGDLTALLEASFDGVAQPEVTVAGVTRSELARFQRFFHGIVGEFIDFGEAHGKKKDAKLKDAKVHGKKP